MIAADHDLMMRATKANRHLGEALLEALNAPTEDLRAVGVREIGRHLGELSADLLAYAERLEGGTVDAVIIDARP
jgi:SAM-dependent MidA family methyltransferase